MKGYVRKITEDNRIDVSSNRKDMRRSRIRQRFCCNW